MSNDITTLAAKLKAAADKATPGEWWSDVVEADGEYGEGEDRVSGYHSYAVYVGNESLLDMTNSTAACIHEEWGDEYHMAWDDVARQNAEFIALANPENIKLLVEALEAAERRIAELSSNNDSAHKALIRARHRTVTLPTGYSVRHGHPINEGERGVMIPKEGGDWLHRFDVEHALRMAGIKLLIEE